MHKQQKKIPEDEEMKEKKNIRLETLWRYVSFNYPRNKKTE